MPGKNNLENKDIASYLFLKLDPIIKNTNLFTNHFLTHLLAVKPKCLFPVNYFLPLFDE